MDLHEMVYILDLKAFLADHDVVALSHINGLVHWAFRWELRRIRANWLVRLHPDPSDLVLLQAEIPFNISTGYELRARHHQRITEHHPYPRRRIRSKCSPEF